MRQLYAQLVELRNRLGETGLSIHLTEPARDWLARKGFVVLPGSDPIPHPEDVDRVGGFGLELDCALNPVDPYHSLFGALGDDDEGLAFGSPASLGEFFGRQIRVRMARGAK